MTLEQAKQLYRRDWWVRYDYHRIQNPGMATKVFDLAVNMGAQKAHKRLQRAVWAVMADPDCLEDDGILGLITTFRVIEGIEGKHLLPPYDRKRSVFTDL